MNVKKLEFEQKETNHLLAELFNFVRSEWFNKMLIVKSGSKLKIKVWRGKIE